MRESKISKRYAKALLGLGQEDGRYQEYGKNLQEFADFCRDNPEFFRAVSSQIFSIEDRRKVLEFALERVRFADVVKNFLRLLLDKNRIQAVVEISDHYRKLTDEISGITSAEVITARPLKKEVVKELEGALVTLTSKKVRMEVKEDETLIGGVVVKLGDLVLDGSVRAQLESLKESLKRGEYS